MQVLSRSSSPERPETVVRRLAAQLSRHVLWDSLLLFAPPAVVAIYVLALLFQNGRLSPLATLLAAICIVGLGVAAVLLRRRPLLPSTRRAARLVDQKSGAKDHFLTLATIDPAGQPPALLMRLRLQAEGFHNRIELRRDFPYRFKRSAYGSLGASLIAVMLIHLLWSGLQPAQFSATAQERLRDLAQQMAAEPKLRGLAEQLRALVSKLDDPKVSPEDKQALAQEMERKIKDEQQKQDRNEDRDLLGQAASALGGLEQQQQAPSGQDRQKDQQKGAGAIGSNAPQDGQGEKQSEGGGGESNGESAAQSQERMDQGKSASGKPQGQGQEKNQGGDAKNNQNQPDPNQPDKDSSEEKAGKTAGGAKDGAGKQQASEEPPPQGGPQADRFYKPGEGREGLAAKGYVTVQMPEEVVADAQGESGMTKESKNSRARTQVPVSNVPLPAHVPNAAAEKQQVPIEYRGIIR
jgi:hypothetical protein